MTLTAYTRANLLDVGRSWLLACLTSDAADGGFDWFDDDTTIVMEPASGPAPSGPYFTIREGAFAVRDSLTGDRGSLGAINDFVHTDLTITALGTEAYDALAWALWFWESGDSYAAQDTLATIGFQVVLNGTEVDPVPEFLETGFDIRGTTVITVGCLRTVERVTVDTSTVVVAGNIDTDRAISSTVSLED